MSCQIMPRSNNASLMSTTVCGSKARRPSLMNSLRRASAELIAAANATMWIVAMAMLAPAPAAVAASPSKSLKVFISNDMEGLTGVIEDREVSHGQPEYGYQYFREVLTRDTNAAIEGAYAAGATEVLVR